MIVVVLQLIDVAVLSITTNMVDSVWVPASATDFAAEAYVLVVLSCCIIFLASGKEMFKVVFNF